MRNFGQTELVRLLLLDDSLFDAVPPPAEEEFSSPLLGRAFRTLWQSRQAGRPVTLAALADTLSQEEMSHVAAVCQQPESAGNAAQALADYIRVIQEEARKRRDRERDPLLAAQEKYKKK